MSGETDRPKEFGRRRVPSGAPFRRPSRFVPVDAPGRVIGPADEVLGRPLEDERDPRAVRFHDAVATILTRHRDRPEDSARIMDMLEARALMSGANGWTRIRMAENAVGAR